MNIPFCNTKAVSHGKDKKVSNDLGAHKTWHREGKTIVHPFTIYSFTANSMTSLPLSTPA